MPLSGLGVAHDVTACSAQRIAPMVTLTLVWYFYLTILGEPVERIGPFKTKFECERMRHAAFAQHDTTLCVREWKDPGPKKQ